MGADTGLKVYDPKSNPIIVCEHPNFSLRHVIDRPTSFYFGNLGQFARRLREADDSGLALYLTLLTYYDGPPIHVPRLAQTAYNAVLVKPVRIPDIFTDVPQPGRSVMIFGEAIKARADMESAIKTAGWVKRGKMQSGLLDFDRDLTEAGYSENLYAFLAAADPYVTRRVVEEARTLMSDLEPRIDDPLMSPDSYAVYKQLKKIYDREIEAMSANRPADP